ncbi:hypothetical protein M1413_04225 [Patescibacteria group bacterium]|jgi:hypoxanthine phosphoribosyltransferase|nr:hypothetical protein [Patescibacteria group bacterium]
MMDLSWEEIGKMADDLAERIKNSGFKPDYLVGITAGGLVPLGLLAKRLDFEGILTVSTKSYDNDHRQKELEVTYLPEIDLKGRRVLLIDEIADSGATLKKLGEIFMDRYQVKELKIATLAVNKGKSAVIPDFYALAGTGEWIHFPWEPK